MLLRNDHISLRALEPSDVDLLYQWENDPAIWQISQTLTPFSHFVIEQYVANSHQDIFTNKQLRLMICKEGNVPVGTIDLFDFDPLNQRAGIGILIAEKQERGKGFASNALQLLIDYCFSTLNLHQVYCNITADNEKSIILFQRHGFLITGIKKEWTRGTDGFVDELLLQKIRPFK
jgi:diamine N-acetyltransferase